MSSEHMPTAEAYPSTVEAGGRLPSRALGFRVLLMLKADYSLQGFTSVLRV